MLQKPNVFLYKTPFAFYVYDANHNEILIVDQQLFNYIVHIIQCDNLDNQAGDEYSKEAITDFNELQQLGYLLPSFVQRVEHPLIGRTRETLARKVDQITLQVTQNCNLRCGYCIYSADSNLDQRSHSRHHMTYETAKKALNFYKEHSQDSDIAGISFYGGEPLLEFDLIRKVVSYAKEIFSGKHISFAITTNATLLTEDVLDYLVENKFILTISMDGPREVHDKNRRFLDGKGSFDIVMDNLHLFYQKYPNEIKNITISMVISPETSYAAVARLFLRPELKNAKLTYTPVEKDGVVVEYSAEYWMEYSYDSFLGYMEYFRKETNKAFPSKLVEQDFEFWNSKIEKFKANKIQPVSAPSGPCLPGKMRLFTNCFEELYPCERVNENSCMRIGTLDDGFDYERIHELLNIGQLTSEKCKNCYAFQLCNVCAKRADKQGKLSASKKCIACEEAKADAMSQVVKQILIHENREHMKRMKKIVDKP